MSTPLPPDRLAFRSLSPTSDSRLDWYCLRAQPKHEAIAAAHLRKLAEIEVFCPRLRFQRPRKDGGASGWTWATEAMFPGYLFACFDLEARHREIHYAHGVGGILRFGEKYPSVPATVIEQLRAAVGPAELSTVTPAPEPGQEVVVTGGAFAGLRAVVTGYLPARQRVRVLLELMGRQLEAEVAETGTIAPFAHPLKIGRPGSG